MRALLWFLVNYTVRDLVQKTQPERVCEFSFKLYRQVLKEPYLLYFVYAQTQSLKRKMLQPVGEPLHLNRFCKNRLTPVTLCPRNYKIYLKRLIAAAFRAGSKTFEFLEKKKPVRSPS